jgi:hypothetical protein
MDHDQDLRNARSKLRVNLARSLFAVALSLWALRIVQRQSVPAYSRWGWIEFFSIVTFGVLLRTALSWRAYRTVSRACRP